MVYHLTKGKGDTGGIEPAESAKAEREDRPEDSSKEREDEREARGETEDSPSLGVKGEAGGGGRDSLSSEIERKADDEGGDTSSMDSLGIVDAGG